MEVEFDDKKLHKLFTDPQATAGFPNAVERGFRKVVGLILQAPNERVLAAFRGLRMEKLQGKRAHQRSLRINDQWRLVIEVRGEGPTKRIGLVAVEDYH